MYTKDVPSDFCFRNTNKNKNLLTEKSYSTI